MHVKTMRKHFTDILNNIYLYNIYRVLVVDSDCCTHIQLFYQRPKIPTYTRKFILYNIIQHTVYFLEQKHTHTHTDILADLFPVCPGVEPGFSCLSHIRVG